VADAATPGTAGIVHLVLFGLLIPLGAWHSRRRMARGPLPPRVPYFISVLVQQAAFLGIALAVAGALDLELFAPYRPDPLDATLGLGFLAAAIVLLRPAWRRQVERRERFVALVAPRTALERALWIGVSVGAGVGEEIAYRGVFVAILAPALGLPAAVGLAALAFALGHLAQGWRAGPVVLAFALGFHALVLATGTLVVAIVVHIAYDIVAGLTYGRLAERYGYPREELEPARTPS
jgi:membrane protease YdiL (CAAX protease family)